MACGCGDLYNTPASAEADENAKRFEAQAESSVVYVYRAKSPVAVIQAFRVFFDEEIVADFTQGRFVRIVASPGTHEVLARTISDRSNRDVLVFETTPGEVYYVELEIGTGAVSGVPSLRVVEEQSAQPRIRQGVLIKRGFPAR